MSKAVRLNPTQFAQWKEERKKTSDFVINSLTGKPIKVGSPTYLEVEKAYQKTIQEQAQKDQVAEVISIVSQQLQHRNPASAAKLATAIPRNPYLYGVAQPTEKDIRERAQTLRSKKPAFFLDEAFTKALIMEIIQMTQQDELKINEVEKIYLQRGIEYIDVQPPTREVIIYIQQYLDKELKKIRELTRSQPTTEKLVKKGVLSKIFKNPETYDTVLKKLLKTIKNSSEGMYFPELIVQSIENYLRNPFPSDEKLVDIVYNAYDVPKDIAAIYAFYIKYLLYTRLYNIIKELKYSAEIASGIPITHIRGEQRKRYPKTVINLTVQSLSSTMRGGKKTKKNVSKK